MKKNLGRVVHWGHELLAEVLHPGDLAVDLTAGNGHDTLMLARLVGTSGQVVAFDLQPSALENTEKRLREAGFSSRWQTGDEVPLRRRPGIDLVSSGHERLEEYLAGFPQAVVANLGYLPGGDPQLTTQTGTTVQALEQASRLLAVGGRLVVVIYIGHPGGAEEGAAVERFFSDLDEESFQVVQLKIVKRFNAPFLLAAEKLPSKI